jgi:hypothetical protein
MKVVRQIATMVLVGGLAAGVLGFAGGGKDGTLEGEIVDTRCYLNMEKRGAEHKKCAVACAKDGIPSGLLAANGKLYTLLVPSAGLADYQASEARVTGVVFEASRAVSPKKLEVKKGGKWVEVALPETMM